MKQVVCTYEASDNFGFAVPDNTRFGTDIFIPKERSKGAMSGHKVVVEITSYGKKGKKPEGKVVEIIGHIDAPGTDILSIVKAYDMPVDFSEKIMHQVQNVAKDVTPADMAGRMDLRDWMMVTIDGEDAKDLDDAVSLYMDGDNYVLGVHIADVSNYVQEHSALDVEALKRGTSVYLVDRVIPMLPKELSNGICSLNEQKDRFAISVIMKINEKGKVVDADIFKSVIKTTRRMNYHDVNDIFKFADMKDGKIELADEELARVNSVAEKYKEFIPHFLRMRELKNVLKQRRDLNGSLNLDIPESKIILNENGIAVDIQKYDYLESNEVIEQFMLTANESVAEKFYWLQAPFIYRVHDVPDIEKVNDLNKFLFNLGYKIRGVKKDDEDSIHPKAFAQVLEEVKGKSEERVVSNLILRTLKVAKYESENRGHFGIASKCYCHFTSPIRRYPDLFIHRVISSYLKHDYNINEELRKKYEIEAVKYAESSSEREKIAQKVERDAEDIKKAEYMKDKVGEIYEGVVSSVTPFGMFVELDNTVEGLIRFENMGNEYFIYDDERKMLVGEKSKTMYKIGDSVKIEVIGADKITRKIDFKLCKE